MNEAAALYEGTVVHARVAPKRHRLAYTVFALAIDVDRITEVERSIGLFSYNRFNLLSLYDRDHGSGRGAIAAQARAVLADAGLSSAGHRILLLCYPRVLGYVFNPISVYFCYDQAGELLVLIYEVNNTYGERTSYVVAAEPADSDGTFRHRCSKEMSVSPFTGFPGHYNFQLRPLSDETLLAIQLREADQAILRTHFAACKSKLTSRRVAWLALRYPFMTIKVISAIHLEALRLFTKGVPLIRRRKSDPFRVSVQVRRSTLN